MKSIMVRPTVRDSEVTINLINILSLPPVPALNRGGFAVLPADHDRAGGAVYAILPAVFNAEFNLLDLRQLVAKGTGSEFQSHGVASLVALSGLDVQQRQVSP